MTKVAADFDRDASALYERIREYADWLPEAGRPIYVAKEFSVSNELEEDGGYISLGITLLLPVEKRLGVVKEVPSS